MRNLNKRGLIYVTENSSSLEYKAFAKALGTEPLVLRTLTVDDVQSDPNIVFDVDLRSASTMRHLAPLMARRGLGCRIFLVDSETNAVRANTRLLDANYVLPSRTKPDTILRTIEAFFGISPSPTVLRSIDAGVEALDEGFRGLVADKAFDTVGMENASGLIADAIDEAGVNDFMSAVRGHHIGTFQHCMLVTATAAAFARQSGMRRQDVLTITKAGLLHDIGKAAIPLEILDKPGMLDTEEAQTMRQHPVIGYDYLANRSRLSEATLRSVRGHHEYLDGSGYPDGLSGAEIDDITRIITIADVYAALVERRAYKPPKSAQEAMLILNTMADNGKLEAALVREFGRIMTPQLAATPIRQKAG